MVIELIFNCFTITHNDCIIGNIITEAPIDRVNAEIDVLLYDGTDPIWIVDRLIRVLNVSGFKTESVCINKIEIEPD